MFNYRENSIKNIQKFLENLKKDGWNPKNYRYKDWDIILNPNKEIRQFIITCNNCKVDYLIFSKIERGFLDYEIVKCEKCNQSLGEIRADWGFDIIATRKTQ
ncbi:MAG: hypothetical protein ACTSO2_00020 [Promethearchaeota archaeon]